MILCDWMGMDLILKCQSSDFCIAWTTNHKDSAFFLLFPLVHFRIFTWIFGFLVPSQRQVWCGWCLALQGRCLLATTGPARGLLGIMLWHVASCKPMTQNLAFTGSSVSSQSSRRTVLQESRKQALQLTISKVLAGPANSFPLPSKPLTHLPDGKRLRTRTPMQWCAMHEANQGDAGAFQTFYTALSLSLSLSLWCLYMNIYCNTYVCILDWLWSYFTSTNY